jgi:Tol biopolymer transport system component
MRADGSEVRRVTTRPGIDFHPIWSPDGIRFAYQEVTDGRTSLVVMDVSGLNKRTLVAGPDALGPFVWSPDGSQIAFTSSRGLEGGADLTDVYVVDVGTGERRLITRGGQQGDCPAWLPR